MNTEIWNHVPIHAWFDGVPIEEQVWTQARNLADVPGVERIALMPDAHVGNGACVGSAILTRDVVIPAAVGVDIGCGMIAAPLSLTVADLQGKLPEIRKQIEKRVPVGRTDNGGPGDRGAWHNVPDDVVDIFDNTLRADYLSMLDKYGQLDGRGTLTQFGTLGTGNHFIEVQAQLRSMQPNGLNLFDPLSTIWLMLHSGSRGVGNRIGTTFTKLARKEMEKYHVTLPDPELAFLPVDSELGQDYIRYANWAQRYAWASRELMFRHALEGIGAVTGLYMGSEYPVANIHGLIHCHHNYISREYHFGKQGYVIRKGAVDAHQGVMGIIPGSMGTRSFITRGVGNPEALMTSSHGAGRVMSRNVARKTITLDEHMEAMHGVEANNGISVLDESPAAYKPIEAVMAAQVDLTEPVVALKQLVVVKG